MSRSTAKDKKWYRDKCDNGCQICGIKFPGRINNGLIMAHIVDDGQNTDVNCLALCPNCEKSFDNILKPAIYKAVTKINKGNVPEQWVGAGD